MLIMDGFQIAQELYLFNVDTIGQRLSSVKIDAERRTTCLVQIILHIFQLKLNHPRIYAKHQSAFARLFIRVQYENCLNVCIYSWMYYNSYSLQQNLNFLLFICKFKLKFTEEMLHIKQTVSSLRALWQNGPNKNSRTRGTQNKTLHDEISLISLGFYL